MELEIRFCYSHIKITVEITEFFSHDFLAKIRESNDFTNKVDDLTKYFFVEESKFFHFSTAVA